MEEKVMRPSKSSQISVEILRSINREGFIFRVKGAVPLSMRMLITSAEDKFHVGVEVSFGDLGEVPILI